MTKAIEREIEWNIRMEMRRRNLYIENKERLDKLMPEIIKAFKKGGLTVEINLMKDNKPITVELTNWLF